MLIWEPDSSISLLMMFRCVKVKTIGSSNVPFLNFYFFHLVHTCLCFVLLCVVFILFQVGFSSLSRASYISPPGRKLSLLHHSLQPLESLMKCVHMGWMVILVGPAAAGKTSLVQLLAYLTGHQLKIMAMNSSMDTTELLGGFEQVSAFCGVVCCASFEKESGVRQVRCRHLLMFTSVCRWLGKM